MMRNSLPAVGFAVGPNSTPAYRFRFHEERRRWFVLGSNRWMPLGHGVRPSDVLDGHEVGSYRAQAPWDPEGDRSCDSSVERGLALLLRLSVRVIYGRWSMKDFRGRRSALAGITDARYLVAVSAIELGVGPDVVGQFFARSRAWAADLVRRVDRKTVATAVRVELHHIDCADRRPSRCAGIGAEVLS